MYVYIYKHTCTHIPRKRFITGNWLVGLWRLRSPTVSFVQTRAPGGQWLNSQPWAVEARGDQGSAHAVSRGGGRIGGRDRRGERLTSLLIGKENLSQSIFIAYSPQSHHSKPAMCSLQTHSWKKETGLTWLASIKYAHLLSLPLLNTGPPQPSNDGTNVNSLGKEKLLSRQTAVSVTSLKEDQ